MRRSLAALAAVTVLGVSASAGAAPGEVFSPPAIYPVGISSEKAVAVGDVNGDGLADVVVGYGDYAGSSGLKIAYQQPGGTMAYAVDHPVAGAGARSIEILDVDGDGRDDIAVATRTRVELVMQQADGSLSAGTQIPLPRAEVLRAGDVTGDGLTDLVVVGWGEGQLHVLAADGAGGFESPVTYSVPLGGWNDLDIGDVDGDGLLDVVAMSGQMYNVPSLSVLIQADDGTLEPPSSALLPVASTNARAVGAGDVDGDGVAEVVVGYGGNRPASNLGVYEWSASGGLVVAGTIPTYDLPGSIEIADVDLDGIGDVVVAHSGWSSVSVHTGVEGSIPGAMDRYAFISGNISASGMDVADVDGDGVPDAVGAGAAGRGFAVVVNQTEPPSPTPQPDAATAVQLQPRNGRVSVGQMLGATVTVTNEGTDPATGQVVITVPDNLELWVAGAPCTQTEQVVCAIEGLEPGKSVDLRVAYTATSRGSGPVTATAEIADDVDQSNDRSAATFWVR
ncbi:FG-GAP-like repeat-containing protein [Actinomarinicola tropica]|nr:FG-GAP-like repeat-containing protein [Actinomarinicola tropica]